MARLREAWGVAPHERVVLVAARLTEWKGQKVLIEAARLLAERGLNEVRYILAGDAQGREAYARELDALIEGAGLTGVVSRVGHCADMPAALVAASVVAVPSTSPEAFGRSAVEAQAMGAMVVVSDSGAAPETVLAPPQTPAQLRTGWRSPPGDARALADALESALTLGATAREVARPARARPCRAPFLAGADDGRHAGGLSHGARRLERLRLSGAALASRRCRGPPYLMNEPSRKSVSAWRISACVFITIGPCQAIGSRKGRPETSRKRIPSSPA